MGLGDPILLLLALVLGVKLAATVILLSADNDFRDRPGLGTALWWTTKITPLIAAPVFTWIAIMQGATSLALVGLAMMLFAIVAVPLKIRQRRGRIAGKMSASHP